jgi:hypothetical protein
MAAAAAACTLCDQGRSCRGTGRCSSCQYLPASSVPSLHDLLVEDRRLYLCYRCACWYRAIKDECTCRKWAAWCYAGNTLDQKTRPQLCPVRGDQHQHWCVCPRLSNFCRSNEHTDNVL